MPSEDSPRWHLVNGLTGNVACQWVDEQRAREWLAKQIELHPNGYYQEIKARIERYPAIVEVQIDLFELISA